ncbi:expressed unknown protein [Seminavis robusta]|uniref:Uncharacterized protein n=1 Tax=Seminavis robusta TaxID=568900 RepID=A0A9N8DVX1_9STRA|nr:expressed unknown protein [Seminavis robusta]|eukprot:Sro321_g116790.1 n/a (283) ;mRNA; f:50869-51717
MGWFEQKEFAHFGEHLAGTLFYGAIGGSMLALTYVRLKALAIPTSRSGGNDSTSTSINSTSRSIYATFADRHIPERSFAVLKAGGLFLMTASLGGFVAQMIGSTYFFGTPFAPGPLVNEFHFMCYFPIGFAAYWESRHRLPLDSARTVLALMLLMDGILVIERCEHRERNVFRKMHMIWAGLILSISIVTGYSVRNPTNVPAYVTGWALFVVMAIWTLFIPYVNCCVDTKDYTIMAFMAWLFGITLFSVLYVAVFKLPPFHANKHMNEDNQQSNESVALVGS